jgi:TolB-like protein/Tfp pilus assembly protein PilF
MMAAILTKDPPSLAEPGKDVPPALQEIVGRCLEKRPEERFSSAHDLALALRAYTTGEAPATVVPVRPRSSTRRMVGLVLIGVAVLAAVGALLVKLRPAGVTGGASAMKKIVVLPFENLGLPEDAYFASGMALEITSRLANVQGLGVISSTSAIECAKRGKTVKEIGADLGVDYVLEGSVRFEHGQGKESRVRITPQLIRVADDTHVWADRYDRVLADVFAMQSEVAESAVKAMGVALLPREQTALKEVSTNDLEAYNLALQGMELNNRGFTREFVEGALQKYQAAVDRDPRFAQAVAGLSSNHLTMYWLDYDHSPERLAKGKELAERAVELRPDLPEPHAALAQYYYHGLLDYPRALDELAIATKIQPSNSYALVLTGLILPRQGRWVEAAKILSKAVELDPRNPLLLSNFASNCVRARRYADADRAFGLATALSPQWPYPYVFRAELQVWWHGDLAKAQAILEEASHVAGMNESFLEDRQSLALLRRDYPEALRLLEAEEKQAINNPHALVYLSLKRGQVQMLAGQPDLARHSYEAARLELEKKIAHDPKDPGAHSSLGIAYAGLGRRSDALREAKLACDLAPASKDALEALDPRDSLAGVYTMIGQPGEAIAVLDDRLSRIGTRTAHWLRLDPTWDPLRSDPRFQALLTKYAVKP